MARAAVADEVAERVLSHKVGSGISQIYNQYAYVSEKRDALERLGKLVHRIVTGQGNVLSFPRPQVSAVV